MPEHLKQELSATDFGLLLTGTPAENVKSILGIIESTHPQKVVVVGDFTLMAFLEAGFKPNVGIFDCKTLRSSFLSNLEATDQALNPAGQITDDASLAIRRIIRRKTSSLLRIDGEEDLLSLPSILNSPIGSLVIYGIPDKGMMVITVDKTIKEKVKKMIRQFLRFC